jgi:alkylglycerol monooxygenase
VTGPTTLLLVGAIALALANGWAAATSRRGIERLTKPAVMVGLIAAVAVADPTADGTVRVLVVGALAASLVGDILLLPGGSLVGGLAAFTAAQVAYGASFGLRDPFVAAIAVGLLASAAIGATVGRRLLRASPEQLRPAVAVYLVVILGMATLATGTLVPAAIVGAWCFVASDALLGWSLFVDPDGGERPGRRVAIMAMYHAAQVLLVLSVVA